MDLSNLKAKKIVERTEYGQGYGEEKHGFEINGRVWFVSICGYGYNYKKYEEDEMLLDEIINRFNNNSQVSDRGVNNG